MRKIMILLTSFLLFALGAGTASALDPVAPKTDRAFGFLRVDTPLPSDRCEILSTKGLSPGFASSCRSGEMMKVPVGVYQLKVGLQNGATWSSAITIHSTEFTKVAVPGFGNLRVQSPDSSFDRVELYSLDGELIKSFPAGTLQTLPMGTYNVMVKMRGPFKVTKHIPVVAHRDNVQIWPEATRELIVSF